MNDEVPAPMAVRREPSSQPAVISERAVAAVAATTHREIRPARAFGYR